MKLFEKILMASEDVKSYLVSGRCDEEALFDGALVAIGDLCDHEVYANLKDMNTRAIAPYTSGAKRYGFVDYVGVAENDIFGNTYRVSSKVAGLECPAGVATRVRIPQIGDEFFLGEDNFDAAVGANGFAVPGADGQMTPAAQAATSGLCLKIEYATDKIVGTVNDGKKYFCTVIAL